MVFEVLHNMEWKMYLKCNVEWDEIETGWRAKMDEMKSRIWSWTGYGMENWIGWKLNEIQWKNRMEWRMEVNI